ncbi:MAG: M56 family metallopeptidase, partial [Pseudonocardiaceae bacterium]
IVLWQITTLTATVAAIGLVLGLGLVPYQRGIGPALHLFVTDLVRSGSPRGLSLGHVAAVVAGLALAGWLLLGQLRSSWACARQRSRHRQLLRLVAEPDARWSALVLDHPVPAAYYLPGRQASVVISSGALGALTDEQRRAVLSHEAAHARERHHLVLSPFHALRTAFPHSRMARRAAANVALLLEMRADDHAAHCHGVDSLVGALRRFEALGGAGTPAGALAVADAGIATRIARLTAPAPPPPRAARALAIAIATVALATPLSLFALPL